MSDPEIKIFISFSSHNRAGPDPVVTKWVNDFTGRLPELTGYSLQEIYFYPAAPLGVVISDGIQRDLQTAEHLICIVSDQYLQSGWCVEEFRLFTSRSATNRSKPLFIFTQFLNQKDYDNPRSLDVSLKHGIDRMEEKDPEFSTKLKPFAESVWASEIREARSNTRSLDLRSNDWTFAKGQLTGLLRRPRTQFLLDYAAVSAYCLGADRYLSGGWGFSVAHVDEHERGDSDFAVPNSSHSLNVVVLRALRSFFTDSSSEIDELMVEMRNAFDAKGPQRNPFHAVQDRLPLFARLLACMAVDRAGDLDFQDYARIAFGALKGVEPSSRWTLALDTRLHTEEYYVALLVCLSKAKEMKDQHHRYWDRLEGIVPADLDSLDNFKKMASGAISSGNLFQMLGADPDSTRMYSVEEAARASIRWLMLQECKDGRTLLRGNMTQTFSPWLVTKRIQGGIENRDPAVITMAAVASLTAILHDTQHSADIPACANAALDALYNHLFMAIDSVTIVPALNAVAWAAIIIMAALESNFSAKDREILRSCWERGRALRENRLDAILKVAEKADKADAFKRSELDEKIDSLVAIDASWCLDRLPPIERSHADQTRPEDRAEKFAELLHKATFWGQRTWIPQPLTSTQSLGGVLRVGLDNKQVELESPGYQKMFLEPFTALTGINVRNLNGIKREFGGLDATLVKFMGDIVVRKVYIPTADGYAWDEQMTFEKRTNEIYEALVKAEDAASGSGMDDLLLVKRGEAPEACRWIHRSAVVQAPRSQGGSRVISWRFVEMSPVAEKLLSDSQNV